MITQSKVGNALPDMVGIDHILCDGKAKHTVQYYNILVNEYSTLSHNTHSTP